MTISRRLRVAVATLAAGTLAMACADKDLLPPKAMPFGKMALQITTLGNQVASPTDPAKFLLIGAVGISDNSGNDNNGDDDDRSIFLGGKWVQFVPGTQSHEVTIDVSVCPQVEGQCQFFILTALRPDTIPLPAVGDDLDNDESDFGDEFGNGAVDIKVDGLFVVGAAGAPTIPPISLSQSRFKLTRWAEDDALRMGTGQPMSGLSPGSFFSNSAPLAGVPGAAGPTLFTLGIAQVQGSGFQPSTPFPALGVLLPGGVWQRVLSPSSLLNFNPNNAFNDVTALAANEAYMSSTTGLYKYDGTAITRVSAINDSAYAVASVITATNQRLVIVGSNGGVVSIGNGTTFTRYTLPGTTQRVDGVCITGPNEAFASQFQGGGLFRFDGTAWTSIPSQFTQGKLDLQCPSAGQAFVLVNGQASGLLRWNGSTWVTIPTTGLGLGRTPIRWGVASQNEIYAWSDSTSLGVNRAYYRFNGTSWSEVGRTRFTSGGGRMWATPGEGYLAGHFARIDRATPAAVSVVSYQPSLYDVIVTSPSNAFAVGANTFLSRWNGSRWIADPPPATMGTRRVLTSVWSDGPNKAWAVGNANTILRWDAGGAGGSGWIKVSDSLSAAGPFDHYWGVWGAGNEAWIVGENTLLRCQLGFVCNTQSSGGGALLGIWGTSATNIFAVGDGGRIMRYNGTTWSGMTSPTTKRLSRVSGTGPNDIWAVGDSVLIHFDGTTWSLPPDPANTIENVVGHIPSQSERLPAQNAQQDFAFQAGIGFWVLNATEMYIGHHYQGLGRWDGFFDTPMTPDRDQQSVMGISGTASGCALAVSVTHGQSFVGNLRRGTGPTACFNVPMGKVLSFP